ncbi:hypothetical protein DFR48_11391 [Ciceribacter lividus]|uniref:Uncharacterized protein n=1 Tax=Ciceribacter lividus TaxID=1197950 RepID=A0A6I7HIU8_9HYPH|nr:hypothetical protein DFR48_11391 [Ciceribacter lividus]
MRLATSGRSAKTDENFKGLVANIFAVRDYLLCILIFMLC